MTVRTHRDRHTTTRSLWDLPDLMELLRLNPLPIPPASPQRISDFIRPFRFNSQNAVIMFGNSPIIPFEERQSFFYVLTTSNELDDRLRKRVDDSIPVSEDSIKYTALKSACQMTKDTEGSYSSLLKIRSEDIEEFLHLLSSNSRISWVCVKVLTVQKQLSVKILYCFLMLLTITSFFGYFR